MRLDSDFFFLLCDVVDQHVAKPRKLDYNASCSRHCDSSVPLPISISAHPAEIQLLVLAGRMGEAIELTQRLYPGLLEKQQNLLFLLRVRQFIEMVNGTDSEVNRGSCPDLRASCMHFYPDSS